MNSLRKKLGYVNEPECINRGLSNSNKVQTVVLKNTVTGEQIELDRDQIRISKLRRRVFGWANTIKDYLPGYGQGKDYRKVMITLTYADVAGWRPNHIRDYIKEFKRRLGDNLIALAWVAELQERGAVHYHVMAVAKKGTRIPMPDKSGMWKHGMSRVETARSVFYLCSYLKKAYQKKGDFPHGMRMYSVWISPRVFTGLSKWFLRLSTLPRWFYDVVIKMPSLYGSKWFRSPGGGWLYDDKLYKSSFVLVGFR